VSDSQGSRPSLRRHPDFVKLWSGETVSQIGTQISLLAIPLIAVTVLHATTFQVGALSAIEMAPFLLVSLFAGVWVDRIRRRPVLIVTDLGRAAALVTLPIASSLGWLSLAQLYVVALVTGTLTVFFDVAYMAYLASLIDRHQLIEGNSKLQASESGAAIIGPGLAGWLIGAVGAARAVIADAASFVVSALAVLWIAKAEPEVEPRATADGAMDAAESSRRRLRTEIGEGLRYVFGHPYLRSVAGCTSTFNLFGAITNALIIVFAVRTLHLTAGRIGLVLSLASVGYLAGALIANRVAKRVGVGRAIIAGATVAGIGPFLIPMARHGDAIPLLVASYLITMLGNPVYNINQVSLRQAITPDRLQGRMNATMRFVVWGTMPLGGLIGGALGSFIGLRGALWVAAAGQASAVAWVLFSPIRGLVEIPVYREAGEEEPTTAAGLAGGATAGGVAAAGVAGAVAPATAADLGV
jgi:MFS family permease